MVSPLVRCPAAPCVAGAQYPKPWAHFGTATDDGRGAGIIPEKGHLARYAGTHSAYTTGMKLITPSHLRIGLSAALALALFAAPASALGSVHANAPRHARRHARAAAAPRARGAAEPAVLHGSKASVEKMYDFALRYRYPFYLTPTNLDAAIAEGRLVPLTGDPNFELARGVGFSYATREVKQFVEQYASQYLYACGTPLTVTSAARPISRQPRNANKHSVHPAGIAVDIRRPASGACLTWVRGSLAKLEQRGLIEATEEHHPVHLHLAILAAPGSRVTLPNLLEGVAPASRTMSPSLPPALFFKGMSAD